MTGSAAFIIGFSSGISTGSVTVCSGSGETVAFRRSLSLALAARMSVLKTCGLLESREM
jgi:hypothetical protein